MTSLNIHNILGKLDELRAVFILGQRTIPFIEEIFSFFQEVAPLLDEINTSIRESTHKMPHATSQLESVTNATELATTEILDLVDRVLNSVRAITSQHEGFTDQLDTLAQADEQLLQLICAEIDDEHVLAQVEALYAQKAEAREALSENVQDDVEKLDEIRDMMNQIMMSLQVQDITTQQLAAVNHLIESIRERLATLIERLGSGVEHALDDAGLESGVTFNAKAKYDRSGKHQALADDVIGALEKEADQPTGPTSQDEIDALFGSSATDDGTPASQDDIDDLFDNAENTQNDDTDPKEQNPATSTSQDEIDALFGAALTDDNGTPASQDDIDDLFDGSTAQEGTPASQDDIDELFNS